MLGGWGMKAICLRARSGPEAFAYEEVPQPRPGEGEVLMSGKRGQSFFLYFPFAGWVRVVDGSESESRFRFAG